MRIKYSNLRRHTQGADLGMSHGISMAGAAISAVRGWLRRATVASKIRFWRTANQVRTGSKRAFDVVVGSVMIGLLAPALVLIALLVKSDGGPVFFRQTRVGLRGRRFQMIKFRSMCIDAEARLEAILAQNEVTGGVRFKMERDPRITPVGRFLRRTSLDELPQLFNVLCGDMTLVGPRPPVPREVNEYTLADRRRLEHKPGITCLWQVGERDGGFWQVGDRNRIDFKDQVELDVRYIEGRSLLRDAWLLIKTLPAMLLGK